MAKWLLPIIFISIAFGYVPRRGGLEHVRHKFYSLGYDESIESSRWTHYYLNPRLINGPIQRNDYFRTDPYVSTGSAGPYDYRGSGLDRGHMVPAGDMKYSRTAMVESFFMSNITPQHPSLNRGRWQALENSVRRFVLNRGNLHIFTGPIFTKKYRYLRGTKIAIPDGYYKILFYNDGYVREAIAFMMKNQKVSGHVLDFRATVDQVEKLTGIDFLHELNDYIEDRIEGHINLNFWK